VTDPVTSPEAPSRRTVAGVFAVSFGTLLVLLLVRSRELFSRVVYEEGDFAANSIITYHAKHFAQLVGNYSRVGFSHPGPAFIYLQAAGEWLLYDVSGVVPSAWNGQAVGILTLNAACVALALTVIYSWFPSWVAVAAAGGGFLAFVAAYDQLYSSTWMPFAYFAPFLLLLITGASVLAGRLRHLWLFVLAGGLLVHGHACFLLFVPLTGLAVLWPHRRRLRPHVLAAAGVAVPFLLPIVLDLVLHFPGQIPKYFDYSARGLHPPLDAARYQLQFWAVNPFVALTVMAGLFLGVRLVARHLPRPDEGRFLRAGVRVTAVATGLFFVYAIYGIDDLREAYVGYFSRAMPLSLLMLGLAGATTLVLALAREPASWRLAVRGAALAALTAGLVAASSTIALVNRRGEVPGVPVALDAMAAQARGRPIVLEVRSEAAWAEAVPMVIAGVRRDQRVCLADERWRLLVTPEFVCTPDELATGERFVVVRRAEVPPGTTGLADVSPSLVVRPDGLR